MKVGKYVLATYVIPLCITLSCNIDAAYAANMNSFPSPAEALLQEDPYLPFAEVMPEMVGGISSVYKKINYPDIARKAGVQGKVYVMVLINERGGVDKVKVVKGIGAGCDEAAVEAIKKAKFTPAKNNGVAVKSKLSLPIQFKL
jgi:protein TonB